MQQLNQNTLADCLTTATRTANVTSYSYDRDNLQAGIVHFGVGNFHRCHQAVYVDKLLSQGSKNWGIVGVSMRSSHLRDQLAPQDFLYTEVTLNKDRFGESTRLRLIGSLLNVLVAPENSTAVIRQVADGKIKLVTTTITEKGYCLSSGCIDKKHPDFLADSASLDSPRTIYGYIAAAAIQRCKQNGPPLSILCCDNIQSGGEHLQTGVRMLLQQHDKETMDWAKKQMSFASSMVDRVAPATEDSLKQLVRKTLELDDAWPVSAEPFSQWVIEDNFAGERPAFDNVGAQFTDDISLFEQMKLRFLNAGHSIISVLGYLEGHPTIHQALEQASILDFVQRALLKNVLPVATIPVNVKGEDYIADVTKRFTNSALPYNVQQVNTDSSQKIQQRWFPTIDDALAKSSTQAADTTLMSFMVAAWVLYIQKALNAGELNDPLHDQFIAAQLTIQRQEPHRQDEGLVHQFLLIAGAGRFRFLNSAAFMSTVLSNYQTLKNTDISTALVQLLSRLSLQQKEVPHA